MKNFKNFKDFIQEKNNLSENVKYVSTDGSDENNYPAGDTFVFTGKFNNKKTEIAVSVGDDEFNTSIFIGGPNGKEIEIDVDTFEELFKRLKSVM